MMSGRKYSHVPSDTDTTHHLSQDEEQKENARKNRRATLRSVLRFSQQNVIGTDGLVELTEMLGLEAELDELARRDPERHRRIEAAQLKLGLTVDELEDRDA